jgi:hypothetical protein
MYVLRLRTTRGTSPEENEVKGKERKHREGA